MTSQILRSRYERHLVCITRHNTLSKMAKICRVIQIKSNQIFQENVHMITDLPTKRIFKGCHSDRHFSEFLPKRWRQKSTVIDMERNYVTVALRVLK